MPELQSFGQAALVPKFTNSKSWVKAQVSLQQSSFMSHEIVYYLRFEPVLHKQKANVSNLDHIATLIDVHKGTFSKGLKTAQG